MKKEIKSLYLKIMIICLVMFIMLNLFQGSIYYTFSSRQFRDYTTELAEVVLSGIQTNIDSYFEKLDEQLDSIYDWSDFLANLDNVEASEYPARDLLSRTEFFQAMNGTYIFNTENELKSGYRKRKETYIFDVIAENDQAALDVLDFIENGTGESTVLCCQDSSGTSYIRFVKRLYQDAGQSEVGYIICDFQPSALQSIIQESPSTDEQYIWILSQNGLGCYLSGEQNANALEVMEQSLGMFSISTEEVEIENELLEALISSYGIAICIYTDSAGLIRNYKMVLTVLGRSFFMSFLLFVVVSILIIRRINKRINQITKTLVSISDGENNLRLPDHDRDEIGYICTCFNATLDRLDEQTNKEKQLQEVVNDARYHALQAQVNPHFLYNTLENIGSIAIAQNCKVINEMCEALARMLRYSIEADAMSKCVTLRQEMDYVGQYMFIQDIRMRNEVQMSAEIEDNLWNLELPRLTIQPLIENSIRHGFKNKKGAKYIHVSAKRDGNDAYIYIDDNGEGFDTVRLESATQGELISSSNHTSIGIQNIRQRIQLLYGEKYGLEIERKNGITRVILRLPISLEE